MSDFSESAIVHTGACSASLELKVVELAMGPTYLNWLFEVLKRDSPKTRLVLDVSRLNRFIETRWFWMISISQVRLTLRRRYASLAYATLRRHASLAYATLCRYATLQHKTAMRR